jgi:hypothetical protein
MLRRMMTRGLSLRNVECGSGIPKPTPNRNPRASEGEGDETRQAAAAIVAAMAIRIFLMASSYWGQGLRCFRNAADGDFDDLRVTRETG